MCQRVTLEYFALGTEYSPDLSEGLLVEKYAKRLYMSTSIRIYLKLRAMDDLAGIPRIRSIDNKY